MRIFWSGPESPLIMELCQSLYDKRLISIISAAWPQLFEPIEVRLSDTMRTTAGRAYITKNYIKLNRRLLESNRDEVEDTFVHELAHIIATKIYGLRIKAHGKEWASIMLKFGYAPTRCHNLDVSAFKRRHKRYPAKCSCREIQISSARRNKILKGKNYRCNKCNARLELAPIERFENVG